MPELQALGMVECVFIDWPKGVKGMQKTWKHLRLKDMTQQYLDRLRFGNIGVALGEVSNGLCAIDIDDDAIVQPFLDANPCLADTLQTHGARGRVFWVRFTGAYPASSKLKSLSGSDVGEFRANGNQSIVWGKHPSGVDYQIVNRKPVALLDFATLKWPDILNPPTVKTLQRPSVSPSSLSSLSYSVVSVLSVQSLEEAVSISIPKHVHSNNECLFRLARALLKLGFSDQTQRLQAFDLWFAQTKKAGLLRPELSRDDYCVEFFHACDKAKVPLGANEILSQAVALAKSQPLPPEAEIFSGEAGKLLVAVCYHLGTLSTKGNWYLACRTAGEIIGKSHLQANDYLNFMVRAGILTIVENNTKTKARRYAYNQRTRPDDHAQLAGPSE